MSVVAIHQPNFFPWLGYFDKIARADAFVLLDHVQSPKTGGTWQNRVKMRRGGLAGWVTAPVVRNYHGVRPVREIEFQAGQWRDDLIKTLTAAYGRAPFFDETMAWLRVLVLNPEQNVVRYNHAAIAEIAQRLALTRTRFLWSSALADGGESNALLVALTKQAGGDTYLCGDGAAGYFDALRFAADGLAVEYQRFTHPQYPQQGAAEFVPGLSVIDALMNCGAAGVTRLL